MPALNRNTARWALLLALALGFLRPPIALPQGKQPPKRAQEPGAIRVEVNLVNVIASVLDAAGKPLAELPKDAFELYEEGRLQKVEVFEAETQQPLDLALMIDTSLSNQKELGFGKEAAAHFLRQVVRTGDRAAVFEFTDAITQVTPFTSDVPRLQDAVRAIGAGAGTAMYDAIYLGSKALEQRPDGRRRVIILITDAGETTSRMRFDDARRMALRAEAMLYTILLRPVKSESGRNTGGEHALVTISDVTGGAMYYPDSAAEFEAIFDRIDRELRTQYRLGYYPDPRPPARSFRRIELRVKACSESAVPAEGVPAKGCTLRYRKGYYTGEEF